MKYGRKLDDEKKNEEKDKNLGLEFSASDLLLFAWQVASGMVQTLETIFLVFNCFELSGISDWKGCRSSRLGLPKCARLRKQTSQSVRLWTGESGLQKRHILSKDNEASPAPMDVH